MQLHRCECLSLVALPYQMLLAPKFTGNGKGIFILAGLQSFDYRNYLRYGRPME